MCSWSGFTLHMHKTQTHACTRTHTHRLNMKGVRYYIQTSCTAAWNYVTLDAFQSWVTEPSLDSPTLYSPLPLPTLLPFSCVSSSWSPTAFMIHVVYSWSHQSFLTRTSLYCLRWQTEVLLQGNFQNPLGLDNCLPPNLVTMLVYNDSWGSSVWITDQCALSSTCVNLGFWLDTFKNGEEKQAVTPITTGE